MWDFGTYHILAKASINCPCWRSGASCLNSGLHLYSVHADSKGSGESTHLHRLTQALIFSSPEPKAHGWANSIPVTLASVRRLSSVRPQFQTSSPLKPLGQLNSNFIWRLLMIGERKFVLMVLVTWPRWPPCPGGCSTCDLVCSIGDVGPTKFVQMIILGWPWPT